MRKHLSVLMLFMRSTLYKFLLIVLSMAAAESVFFALAFRDAKFYFGLDTILATSRLPIVCAVGFLLLCALMCLPGCEFGSKQGYTLSRLRISQRMVFLWQSVNNAGLLLLFWAAQVGIIFAFCSINTKYYPQPQATMLVFYANDFLHSLLPLEETAHIVCNIIIFIALAATSACFSVNMRRGKKPIAFFILVLILVRFFSRAISNVGTDLAISIAAIIFSAFAVYFVLEEPDDEELS